MSNKMYDTLKYLNQIAIPAVATALAAILALFKIDTGTIAIITGVIAALNTCLGALLGVSQVKYAQAQKAAAEAKLHEGK